MAYLDVVVPPEIVDKESSGETEVEEGSSVNLVCKAKGHPTPRVSWQRERGEKIVLREQSGKKGIKKGKVYFLFGIILSVVWAEHRSGVHAVSAFWLEM